MKAAGFLALLLCSAGVSAQVAPMLAFNPAAGTAATPGNVSFPAGMPGAANVNIVVTPSGGSGATTTTLSGCAVAGGTPAAFTVPAGTLSFVGPTTTAQNLGLSCNWTLAVAQTTTLTCAEQAGAGAPVARVWTLSCPAAINIGGTLGYAPAPGALITLPAVVLTNGGESSQSAISVIVTMGSAGQVLTNGSCVVTGANAARFSTTPPTLTFTVPTLTSQNRVVTFAPTLGDLGAADSAVLTAALTCSEVVQGGPTTQRFWPLSGTVVRGVTPAIVPSNHPWSLLLLGSALALSTVLVLRRVR